MLPYIELVQYGLHLRQMRDTDLEVVRKGRNQPFVRSKHFHENIISAEQHAAWYSRISQTGDYYLIAHKEEIPLGLLYLKDITRDMATGQIGIFFWEKSCLRTRTPILSIIIFLDFFLTIVGVKRIHGLIRMNNYAMKNIAKFFNCQFSSDAEKNATHVFITREIFLENRPNVIQFAQRLSKNPESWNLHVTGDHDPRHPSRIKRLLP